MALSYIDFSALNSATSQVANTGVSQKTKDVFGLVISGLQTLGPTLALLLGKQGIDTTNIASNPTNVAAQLESKNYSLSEIQALIEQARSANTPDPPKSGFNIDTSSPTTYIAGFCILIFLYVSFKYIKL